MKIEIDDEAGVVTVEGMRYSLELLRGFGRFPIGTVLRIEMREDGVITFSKHEPPYSDLKADSGDAINAGSPAGNKIARDRIAAIQ